MNKWRARVLAKIVNKRGQQWLEQTEPPPPSNFGFRNEPETGDALFMVRRLDEEISAWQHHGIDQRGPFTDALHGFHCCRQYQIKTGPDLSAAFRSIPFKPSQTTTV